MPHGGGGGLEWRGGEGAEGSLEVRREGRTATRNGAGRKYGGK